MKAIKNRKKPMKKTEKEVRRAIDGIFDTLHRKAKTKSGDITPQQFMRIEDVISQLATAKVHLTEIIAEQVEQNTEWANRKFK